MNPKKNELRSLLKRISLAAISLMAFLGAATPAAASDLLKDFDSLGGNNVLYDKARALNPDASIRVVQDRIVDRRRRVEIAPEYGNVLGGDSYNKTHNLGLNAHFHVTPRWSVGLKYTYALNRLRPEGQYLINDVKTTGKGMIPEIDYPKQEALVIGAWYPIYGKMNLYELGVMHFDVYALLGAGQVELKSGATETYTGGGGLGIWISQHLATRFELRYQTYTAKRYTGDVRMDTTVAGVQIGYML